MSGALVYVNGNLVNWISKRQSTVALSTCEAEVYAMTVAVTDSFHVWNILHEMYKTNTSVTLEKPIQVYCDNMSAVHIAESTAVTARSKWFDIRTKFLADWSSPRKGMIQVNWVDTTQNPADALTKSLGEAQHEKLSHMLLGDTLPPFMDGTSPQYDKILVRK